MERIIWTCWFQGRDQAPPLVERCIASWEQRNPGWRVRCLDARTIRRYVDSPVLEGKTVTHASAAGGAGEPANTCAQAHASAGREPMETGQRDSRASRPAA